MLEGFFKVTLAEYKQGGDASACPSLMMTTSFRDLLQPFSEKDIRPFLNRGSPFQGWSPLALHEFFCDNCSGIEIEPAPSSEEKPRKFDPLPAGTFAVLDVESNLDSSSPFHRTVLLCTNLPDFHEGNKFFLKTTRVLFEDLLSEATSLETLTRCLSEIGKAMCLSLMPPALLSGGIPGRRRTISFGLDNDCPWDEEHLSRQPGQEKGFESFEIIPRGNS